LSIHSPSVFSMEGLAVADFPRSPSLGKVSEKTVHECSRIVEGFYHKLNCALAIDKNVLFIISERPITGLDAEELEGTVMQVSYQADKLDNELSDEFGSKMYWAQQG
ncbi:MAG: hypothetical protein V3U74_05025, partial [Thermodesulfobacteriota bacterium]